MHLYKRVRSFVRQSVWPFADRWSCRSDRPYRVLFMSIFWEFVPKIYFATAKRWRYKHRECWVLPLTDDLPMVLLIVLWTHLNRSGYSQHRFLVSALFGWLLINHWCIISVSLTHITWLQSDSSDLSIHSSLLSWTYFLISAEQRFPLIFLIHWLDLGLC